MLRDKQLELQMQFLEKATDDLNTLEVVLFEVKLNHQITVPKINAGLRAVHSIKGGAGITGFRVLSHLAHCLEDYLIFLKNQNNCLEIDPDLLNLLLSGVDWLRQIIKLYSEGRAVNEQWLTTFCYPVFQEIQEHLNKQNCENNVSSVLPEKKFKDFISLLFQTEIEEYLQRLESFILSGKDSVLREELMLMASELGDLGQMLQIQAFTQLCQSILKQLKSTERVAEIAQLALQAWRRSQQAIVTHQLHNVPSEILVNEDSLAKQISRKVDTRPGIGTTFTLSIPKQ
jgi:chemotaxis protein histidine kinase CheA